MINYMLLALVFVAMAQPSIQRALAAGAFVVSAVLHSVLFSDVDATSYHIYYVSAMLFNLAVALVTSGINPVPRAVLRIQILCGVMAAANGLGLLMWLAYWPEHIYNGLFVVLYAVAIYILVRRDRGDVGGYEFHHWRACIRFDRNRYFKHLFTDKGSL